MARWQCAQGGRRRSGLSLAKRISTNHPGTSAKDYRHKRLADESPIAINGNGLKLPVGQMGNPTGNGRTGGGACFTVMACPSP